MSQLGITIARLRMRTGLQQIELAHKVGISKGYMSSIENGKVGNPSARIMVKLAEALDVTTDALLSGEPEPVSCHHYGVEWEDPHLQAAVVCVACGERFAITREV